MGESKTHFEQIPVEIVKKIATTLPASEFPEEDATVDDTADIQNEDKVTSPQERWREVAQKVQQEADPQKMIGLVQELIATFEDEHKRPPHPRSPEPYGDSGEGQS